MQSVQVEQSQSDTYSYAPSDRRTEIADIEAQMLELIGRLKQLAIGWPGNLHLEESILYQQRALTSLSTVAETPDEKDLLSQVDWKAFGLRLIQHREAAKMQQKELAGLLDVTPLTIRNIESAAKRPSRDLLFRLLAIPELNLKISDLTGEDSKSRLVATSWVAPQYDPHKMLVEMAAKLNGSGDTMEQTTAYLDSRSAADYLSISLSPAFLSVWSNTAPLKEAAERVTAEIGRGTLDIYALGSGDARRETTFAQYCLEHVTSPSYLRMHLLDISHTILMEGYNYAKQHIAKLGATVWAMHGNFHHLSGYPMFETRKKGNSVRVFSMLGNTLANLDNEVRFFRDTLSGCVPGDYFLADFTVAHASADSPDEIRQKDPVLRTPVPAARANWLGGPLRRYCKELRDVEFSVELDTQCPIRGSYETLYVATASMIGGMPPRRFVMFRCKLYDPTKLVESLASIGWQCELLTPYAGNDRNKIMLMLLRKQ